MTSPRPLTAALDAHASATPDHPFLLFGGASFGYREAAETSLRLANALRAWGVAPGDRIAIMSGNRPEFLWAWFAATRIGAIEVPVNVSLRGRLLAHVLRDSGARVLFVEEQLADVVAQVREQLPDLAQVVIIGDPPPGCRDLTFARLCARGSLEPIAHEPTARDISVIGYTSGTTGPSKGVAMDHRAVWNAGADAAGGRGLRAGDVFSTSLPLFHLNAQHLTTAAVLAVGATVALEPKFSASGFWRALDAVRATHVNLVGAMLGILLQAPPSPEERPPYRRFAFAGPLPPDIARIADERWNMSVFTGYGSTESGIITYARADDLPEGSCGQASEHFEVQIMDDDGAIAGPGTVGEIVSRPRRPGSMMTAYWGRPEQTVEAFRDLWFHSGDLGRKDAAGYIYFVDRKKDAIRRRGENISSFELESLLRDYPPILEAAAIGVPSALSEEDVKICVRVDEQGTFDIGDLLTWCAAHLPRYMIPRYIEVVSEFPRTPTQRIEKYRLRETALNPRTWDVEAGAYFTS